MLARLDAWLSETLAAEPPPPGIDPGILAALGADAARAEAPGRDEPPADRVTLCAALTALTQEVKLQGRAFKQLDDTLGPLAGWGDRVARVEQAQRQLAESVAQTVADLRRQADDAGRAERAERQAVVSALLDLYDRLKRGLDSCRGCLRRVPRRGLWARILRHGGEADAARAAVEALAEGCGLTLARLLEALRDLDIMPVGEAGAPFDPHTMTAVGSIECEDRAAGTVLEVYAVGFVRCGDVLREAKVVVAAAPRAATPRAPGQSPDSGTEPPSPARSASLVEPKSVAASPAEPVERAP